LNIYPEPCGGPDAKSANSTLVTSKPLDPWHGRQLVPWDGTRYAFYVGTNMLPAHHRDQMHHWLRRSTISTDGIFCRWSQGGWRL